MRVLKSIVCLVVVTAYVHTATAQYYYYDNQHYEPDLLWEAGVSAGVMNCFTDLGGRKGLGKGFIKDLNAQRFNFASGFYAGALYKQTIGARLEATFGRISATDKVLEGDESEAKNRYQRNLHFKSRITEVALLAEFHPLTLLQSVMVEPSRFSPYLLAGVGLFHFDPQAYINNRWVSLQPLHTEGQGFAEYAERRNYALTQVNFPLGIGVRYEISALFNARMEVVHRVLRTDYLDDVSTRYIDPSLFGKYMDHGTAVLAAQLADRRPELNSDIITGEGEIRGDPKDKDSYFTIQFKLSMSIGRTRR
jgi:hypothetical protein